MLLSDAVLDTDERPYVPFESVLAVGKVYSSVCRIFFRTVLRAVGGLARLLGV